jgi:predicted ribosome quality control (RQC) complex YloA/Tae2 family protein
MYSSFWIYQQWASFLFNRIHKFKLIQSLSYDKDSIFLYFNSGSDNFTLELKFIGGELFLVQSDKIASDSKTKGQFQFKHIDGAAVTDVGTRIFDRLIYIEFNNGWKLWLKGFGRFGNVLLQNPNAETAESIFRLNIKADWEQNIHEWDNYKLSLLNNRIIVPDQNIIDLKCWNSMVKSVSFEQLIEYGFNPDFFQLADYKMQCRAIYIFLTQEIKNIHFVVVEKSKKLNVEYVFNSNIGRSLEDCIENIENITGEFIRWYFFFTFKENFIDSTTKKIKQDKSLLNGYTKRSSEIKERRSYREIGDLILAHAHSIGTGVTNALVMDYYTNQRIRVKLDPQLSAPENAQKYYRKAKNEYIELQKLDESIQMVESRILLNTQNLEKVMLASQFKDIKDISKKGGPVSMSSTKNTQSSLPYKLYDFEGYEIWVGKNARSNDELIRLSSKNDLWLHVRDYSGSHVIIKQKGRDFPQAIIEKAANLAAFHSKAKHQTLVQVIYTPRKYVSKPKKALPGEVNVLQESFIDVEPKDFQ